MAEQDTQPDAPQDNEQDTQTPEPAEQATDAATATAEAPQPARFKPSTPPEGQVWWWGLGRRKTAIARVRIRPGSGTFTINKRKSDAYFTSEQDLQDIIAPLQTAGMVGEWDVHANVQGGGPTGQAGAVQLGLARALAEAVPEIEHDLRDKGLLTRDARMKERKKPGQPGARARFQFSKR